ncbi:NAD(P)-dependent oxidoreductase [Clostridium felsineum]|uniref:precorrin-2 dehydrogenase n=1 Tax=Clostridium felsineum TaxID=36839 RepID=A0A1S8MBM8_9CLOT|nr:NAD(P)-dependent oxidoreductase [Clostridium felsineum]MCR3758947.1 NAD(P)-dependent oxidoreductase [Clostridium felsineum]URZ02692.1 Siroheme synthase [Clostridium felsineum]URZ08985.1 Siroheme synthase [Clostridium felsineum]URZ09613.1 Siroheme synthase [Clostridium felsineum]URZ14045.1 Siroheme synthase [Clostridium felsineum DSM 794]
MLKDNKKDISERELENSFISLISHKIKLLVVGGGNAAYIKVKNFIKRGCSITVVSKAFIKELKNLEDLSNIKLIQGEYKKEYIKEHHLVVIATNDLKLNEIIRQDCDDINKLYMDCSEPEQGLYIVPYQKASRVFSLSIKTNEKSPKTSKYILDKAMMYLKKYEDFSEYTAKIRNKIKVSSKREVMSFICSDDFYFFYNKGKADIVLQIFYREL